MDTRGLLRDGCRDHGGRKEGQVDVESTRVQVGYIKEVIIKVKDMVEIFRTQVG